MKPWELEKDIEYVNLKTEKVWLQQHIKETNQKVIFIGLVSNNNISQNTETVVVFRQKNKRPKCNKCRIVVVKKMNLKASRFTD